MDKYDTEFADCKYFFEGTCDIGYGEKALCTNCDENSRVSPRFAAAVQKLFNEHQKAFPLKAK